MRTALLDAKETSHAQCDVSNAGFTGGGCRHGGRLRSRRRDRLSLLHPGWRLGRSGRLLLPVLRRMHGERVRATRLLQRQSSLRLRPTAAGAAVSGLLKPVDSCHYPPPGRRDAPPDDRLQRVIQYSRDSATKSRGHSVLDAPLSRGLTRSPPHLTLARLLLY